jgi:cellulose synthase/poly-beta-1,6-N-acetylglucosamine synthase-like glycosyltransferase
MDFSVGLYILGSISFFLDLIDVLVRLYLRRGQTLGRGTQSAATSVPLDIGDFTAYEAKLHLRPYAVVASVHNAAAEIEAFVEHLQPYRAQVWIIDDASTDRTWERLQTLGVQAIRSLSNRNKPGALKTLLTVMPAAIETIVVLDPDSRILTRKSDVDRALFEFQRSGMAALCPRITVRGTNHLLRLQRLEYALAFTLGRKSLGDCTVTSGLAVYRRDALEQALSLHSLSVYAEDLENAILLLSRGERVYYDGRVVVETDAPERLGRLFSQRVGWQFGLIRVYADRWRAIGRHAWSRSLFFYQYVVYIACFGLLMHPLKVGALPLLAVSAANGIDALLGLHLVPDGTWTNPVYFVGVFAKYILLITLMVPLTVFRAERRLVWPIVPLYPFYAVLQVLPSTVGYVNWLSLKVWRRRVYRDHYEPASA